MLASNLPTLLAITVFTSGLVGCLLLLSWFQHRRIYALALWGSAFIIAAVATVLIVVARDTIPDFWSIVIGNAIPAAAYGLIWSGARNFEGKRVSIVLTLAGALVWLAAVPSAQSTLGRKPALPQQHDGPARDFALVWAEEGLEAVRKVAKKSPEAFVAIAARIFPTMSGSRLNKPSWGNEFGRLFAHARSDCCYQGKACPMPTRCSPVRYSSMC